jgi:hypothetical protein
VHPCSSSCTSSGATLVRCHASSHTGFACTGSTTGAAFFFDFDDFAGPSLLFNLEKKLGMMGDLVCELQIN